MLLSVFSSVAINKIYQALMFIFVYIKHFSAMLERYFTDNKHILTHLIIFINSNCLHNDDYFLYLCRVIITILTIKTKFMRRINDLSSIRQLLFDIHRDKMDIEKESDNELQVICPYLPSFLVSKISSSISVGVYPCGVSVLICFDKL